MDGAVIRLGAGDDTPEVRQDLSIYSAGEDREGDVIWHLHDPLSNKYYRMEERDIELLALIGQRSAQDIAAKAKKLGISEPTVAEVEELIEFMRQNNLVRADKIQLGYYEGMLANARPQEWWRLALRNPIFFRIPMWNPDAFLTKTLPLVRWLGTTPVMVALLITGFLGFYLVLQQIDKFFATFLHFFNWSGAAIYLLVLLSVKVLHELGHAYTAKMMGCRVPVIGVAFMVGWPIMYTDTSDAWKIPEKNKRLRIGAAGVGVEMGIAVLSLFLWAVSPDGALKSAFFLLATTTWLLSVFVNFNPLMRFDGYYLLSDFLEMPNMERRSFAMAKWWLREKLFGLGLEPDEQPKLGFVLFAFGVWTYRFLLFLGIALLIYGFFFKLAGIALFIVEIVYFIARPIFNEMKAWWELRDKMSFNAAAKRTIAFLIAGLGILFIPWYSDVTTPATLNVKSNDLYLPVPGRLLSSPSQTQVAEGDSLFVFESPELELDIDDVTSRYQELSWIRSSLGFDSDLRNEALIVESELRTQNQRLRSLVEQKERLNVVAPFSGVLVDVSPDLAINDWIPQGAKLATVIDLQETKVDAYLPERQLSRVEVGMTAKFIPDALEYGVHDMVVTKIEFLGTPQLDNLYIASTFGGDVAVRESDDGELLTVQSYYKVKLEPVDGTLTTDQVVRGVAVIDGRAESLFSRMRKAFVAIFIRETGF